MSGRVNSVLPEPPPLLNGDLVDRVRASLVARDDEPTPAAVAAALRDHGRLLGQQELLDAAQVLRFELAGAGPLEPLLHEAGVSDVVVNCATDVWVDRGAGLERAPVRFASEAAVRRLAVRLATTAGRRLDDAHPFVDARLPDGTRLHAVLGPIAGTDAYVSLRVPSRRDFTLADLVAAGSMSAPAAEWLVAIVEARIAFLISGGTGSGKTTLLSCLLTRVPATHRVVVVEDASELRPDHPHVVRLEARRANAEGVGAVSLRDLVRQALRMRPDRLVVGEVRGAEVVDLLAALNTGHEGGCGTVHANSAADVPARIEALAVPAGLSRDAVHSQLAAALDVVVHVGRDRSGLRRVEQVCVLERDRRGLVHVVPALTFARDTTAATALDRGPGHPALLRRLRQSV